MGKTNPIQFVLAMALGLGSITAFSQTKTTDTVITKDLFSAMTLVMSGPSDPMPYDLAIPRFETTDAGKRYLAEHGSLPPVRDAWGYPPPVLKEPKSTKTGALKKPGSKPKWKNLDLIQTANADSFTYGDWNASQPEWVNCRTSTAATGYFRAYFEDFVANAGSSTNQGYAHPVYGLARREAVCQVLVDVANLINLNDAGVTPDLFFSATLPPNTPPGALASASTYYGIVPVVSGLDNGTLHYHITSRQDPTPGANDFDGIINTNWNIQVTTNTGAVYNYSWYTNQNENPNWQWFDFKTVMMHEVFHALGFAGSMSDSVTTTNIEVFHNTFNENSYAQTGTNRFFNLTLPLTPKIQAPVGGPSTWFINNTGIYQGTPNFVGATISSPRALYNPTSWASGSSLSHFDKNRAPTPAGTIYVMHPNIGPSEIRPLHNHEIEVLCHLGYQVEGNCDVPSPFANQDMINLTSSTQCVPFLLNDTSFTTNPSGGYTNLSVHSAEIVSQPSGVTKTYFTGSYDCGVTGANTNSANPVGAKSVLFSNNINLYPISFKYKVKDSVSNRISQSAMVYLSNCTSVTNEYVCNGDFEQGVMPGATNMGMPGNYILSQYKIPFWQVGYSSPDFVFKNYPGTPQSYCNLPYAAYPNLPANQKTWVDMNNNQGSYAGSFMDWSDNDNEMLAAKLKMPLTVGQTYKLQLDVTVVGKPSTADNLLNVPRVIKAGLHTQNMDSAAWNYVGTIPGLTADVIINQSVPVQFKIQNAIWSHLEQTFVAQSPYEYMIIYSDHLPGGPIPILIDNVSIQPVSSNHSISGVVYNDTNNNGSQNPGENELTNRTVGLFSNTNPPVLLQTVNTLNIPPYQYKFPLGSNYQSSYLVALMPETNYQVITEPTTNSSTLITNYQHVKTVAFNGGHVTGKNFGVILNGQPVPNPVPSPGPDNIVCAGTPPQTNFNTSLTALNNVPLYSCYLYTGPTGATECLYNTANPASNNGSGWNAGCPSAIAGANCCGWTTACGSGTTPTVVNGSITHSNSTNGGSINLTVTGLGPFTYLWSNGATTEDLTNVVPGTYQVTVYNANGCMTNATYVVATTLQLSSTGKPGCRPGATNAVDLTVTGGTAPYTYSWTGNNGSFTSGSTEDLSNLLPGTFTVVVTDSSNPPQSATHSVSVDYFPPIIATQQVTQATAPSYNNGSITVTITSGGVPQFTYGFSGVTPPQSSVAGPMNATTYTWNNIVGSSTGHNLWVTDSKGCSIQWNNVKVPKKLMVSTKIMRTCKTNPATSMIEASVQGGTGPFTYVWKKNGVVVAGQTNFYLIASGPAGNYTVTVTDQAGQVTTSASVYYNGSVIPLHVVNGTVVNPTANSLGSITVNVTNGIGPFTYTITPPGTSSTMTQTAPTKTYPNLSAGSYVVKVSTDQACEVSKTFLLKSNPIVLPATLKK